MAFYDLRDFLESCRKENDLIEVDRYVDVNLEMAQQHHIFETSPAIGG